jgi:hypothetical protein
MWPFPLQRGHCAVSIRGGAIVLVRLISMMFTICRSPCCTTADPMDIRLRQCSRAYIAVDTIMSRLEVCGK